MKIAYAKLTQNVDLHPGVTSQVFTYERFGLMKELVRCGHEIRIIATINKVTQKLIDDVKAGTVKKVNGMDVRWMKHLECDPYANPKDEDVLFVEHSAVNTMFGNDGEGPLQLFTLAEQVRSFKKGLVVFFNADPDLPFPIHKFAGAKYDWDHEENPYRTETKNNTFGGGKYNFKKYTGLEDYGWGNWEDFFCKNKKIVILTKSINPHKMVDEDYGGTRGRHTYYHKKGLLNIEGIPSVYPDWSVKEFDFNENPEYDIFYAGYPHGREKTFLELFTDMPRRLKMVTSGQWNAKKKRELLLNYNHRCLGMLKGLRGVPEVCNNSRAILHMGVKKSIQFDYVMTRHFEAIFSKAICLYDGAYTCMGGFLGEAFGLHGKTDAMKKYLTVTKMPSEQRYLIWQYQYELCKKYNFEWYVVEFEKMCKRYGVKVKERDYEAEPVSHTKEMLGAVRRFTKTSDKVSIDVKISKRVKSN